MMYIVRVTIAVGIVRVWDVCTGRPCLWKWILRPYKSRYTGRMALWKANLLESQLQGGLHVLIEVKWMLKAAEILGKDTSLYCVPATKERWVCCSKGVPRIRPVKWAVKIVLPLVEVTSSMSSACHPDAETWQPPEGALHCMEIDDYPPTVIWTKAEPLSCYGWKDLKCSLLTPSLG